MPTPITKNRSSMMELRRQPGTLPDRVFHRGERIAIEKADEARAVIVPVRWYEDFQRRKQARERYWQKTQELQQAFTGVDRKEIEAAIDSGRGDIMASKKLDDSPVYQLKVTVKGSKPPIWRRIQVKGSTTLGQLHEILQIVMGWTDSHLHQFVIGGQYYGVPDPDWDMVVKNERRVKLGQIISNVKDRFMYEYDFGDSWEHELVVEKVLVPETGAQYPVCLTGKRACPPEDVGGIWGYGDFLEAIGDPAHPEHDMYTDWVGGTFDPEALNIETINQKLRRR